MILVASRNCQGHRGVAALQSTNVLQHWMESFRSICSYSKPTKLWCGKHMQLLLFALFPLSPLYLPPRPALLSLQFWRLGHLAPPGDRCFSAKAFSGTNHTGLTAQASNLLVMMNLENCRHSSQMFLAPVLVFHGFANFEKWGRGMVWPDMAWTKTCRVGVVSEVELVEQIA